MCKVQNHWFTKSLMHPPSAVRNIAMIKEFLMPIFTRIVVAGNAARTQPIEIKDDVKFITHNGWSYF